MDGKFSTFQAIPIFTNLHYRKLPSKGLNILLKTYINIVEDSGNLQRVRKGHNHSRQLPFSRSFLYISTTQFVTQKLFILLKDRSLFLFNPNPLL